MVTQTTNNRKLKVGSVDIRVALYTDTNATVDTAISVGRLDGVVGRHTGDRITYSADNGEDIDGGIGNEQYEVGGTNWSNIDLEVLHLLTGHTGDYAVVPGTPVAVTDELIALNDSTPAPLKNKTNAIAPTLVESIAVTDTEGSAYALETDYTVELNVNGQTCIQRVEGGGIEDGEVVKVSYSFTPAASKTLSFGGGPIPVPLHLWLVNTQADGTRFIVEVYKCTSIASTEFSYGNDKAKSLINMPVTIIGKPDSTRRAKDQLFKITDEVTVIAQA